MIQVRSFHTSGFYQNYSNNDSSSEFVTTLVPIVQVCNICHFVGMYGTYPTVVCSCYYVTICAVHSMWTLTIFPYKEFHTAFPMLISCTTYFNYVHT